MKKALMAAAAFVALPVMAQAAGTSIKIDSPGINLLLGDNAAGMQDIKNVMYDVKTVEFTIVAMKESAVGLDFRVTDVGKHDSSQGILALAPIGTEDGIVTPTIALGAIGGGSGAITADPAHTLPVMFKGDRSNLSATLGISFLDNNNPGRYYGAGDHKTKAVGTARS